MITPIESLTAISGLQATQKDTQQTTTSSSDLGVFGSIFQNAIQNVKDTDADLVQAEYLLSTGQLDNPATVSIAATKSELAVDLLVQLRSKALDAYSELTRMSV
jgi:flagellar hook-basal body complex protein FliE